MSKTADEYFRDWYGNCFHYGYGTGEEYIVPALQRFFERCEVGSDEIVRYDSTNIEFALTPTVAWLMIDALCREDVLQYGTSPRFGWLTEAGKLVRTFALEKTTAELLEICTDTDDCAYMSCYRDVCNCGPGDYKEGRTCQNPFWGLA